MTHIYGKMGFHMKTTVEIPDALFIAAKKRAAEERTTLRQILERSLRRELGRRMRQRTTPARHPIRWVTVDGGLPEGLNVADRAAMHEWLRSDQ